MTGPEVQGLLAVPEVASAVGDRARVERVRALAGEWEAGAVRQDEPVPGWDEDPGPLRVFVYLNDAADLIRAALDQGGSDGGDT